MTEKLLGILDSFTNLRLDVDLFYLEIPLNKSGLWVSDRGITSVRSGYQEYDAFYRGKDKKQCIKNIQYLQDTIDNLDVCNINGDIFKLKMTLNWDYLGKDTEGYFVFATILQLQ